MQNIPVQVKDIMSYTTIAYLSMINAAGLISMAWDKLMSKRGKKRIPEKRLLLTAIIGGSLGVWLGMILFRHKTRHVKFVLGIPVVILIQAAAVALMDFHF